jgi:hypothetical protein
MQKRVVWCCFCGFSSLEAEIVLDRSIKYLSKIELEFRTSMGTKVGRTGTLDIPTDAQMVCSSIENTAAPCLYQNNEDQKHPSV